MCLKFHIFDPVVKTIFLLSCRIIPHSFWPKLSHLPFSSFPWMYFTLPLSIFFQISLTLKLLYDIPTLTSRWREEQMAQWPCLDWGRRRSSIWLFWNCIFFWLMWMQPRQALTSLMDPMQSIGNQHPHFPWQWPVALIHDSTWQLSG